MNLAHRFTAIGAFSKVMCTIVDFVEDYALKDMRVNEVQSKNKQVKELQRK